MAIIDADYMMQMPKGLTAASGIDALTQAIDAYVSRLRTEPADGMALQAGKAILKYLPRAYNDGPYMMQMPKGLTAASGIDALTQAIDAYVSRLRTEPADGMALQAGKAILKYLPRAYNDGPVDPETYQC